MAPPIAVSGWGHALGYKEKAPRGPASDQETTNRPTARPRRRRNRNSVPTSPLKDSRDRGHPGCRHSCLHDHDNVVSRVHKPVEKRFDRSRIKHSNLQSGSGVLRLTHPIRAQRLSRANAETRAQRHGTTRAQRLGSTQGPRAQAAKRGPKTKELRLSQKTTTKTDPTRHQSTKPRPPSANRNQPPTSRPNPQAAGSNSRHQSTSGARLRGVVVGVGSVCFAAALLN